MTFVISWINWFDYELQSEVIESDSALSATKEALLRLTGIDSSEQDLPTVEACKEFAFDCDGMVNALQVN